MEKEIELLPCPFCDGTARYRCSNDGDYIECSVCGLGTTIHERGHPNAVSRWNTRTASAREARLVEALEQEVYRLNNHDMHLDIGGMAEDATVPCPVCEACDRIWAIIHPEDANKSGGEK